MSVKHHELRQYDTRNTAAFKKTTEKWGGFSNMAGGFPVIVNGVSIPSVEALYQACRFPGHQEIQQKIIQQSSPMTAKMVSKPHLDKTREDWEQVRVLVMKWVLRIKLAQHWDKFSSLLLSSGAMPIVELSNKDSFWGAKPESNNICIGVNALGRLLMELRQQLNEFNKASFTSVPPLQIENFKLYGDYIRITHHNDLKPSNIKQNDMFD